jgi:hypothetical protein
LFCSDYKSTRDRLPVTRVLDRVALVRGLPRVLRADNALEVCGRAMLTWAHERRVTLRLIEPGKPNQNAYIESFNGRFRDECLNVHQLRSIADAKEKIETWRVDHRRPHSSLGQLTPTTSPRAWVNIPETQPIAIRDQPLVVAVETDGGKHCGRLHGAYRVAPVFGRRKSVSRRHCKRQPAFAHPD